MKEISKKCMVCGASGEKIRLIRAVIVRYKNKVYIYYRCNPCNTKIVKNYTRTESGKISIRKSVKKYEEKNKIKRISWNKASCIPLSPCEICGINKNVDRHHEDSTKPLEVKMLCRLHHRQAHRDLV